MAPKAKRCDIRAIQRRLRDETSEDEQTPALSRSLEDLNIRPDPEADRPQTRATIRAGQTLALVVHTPHSNEGDHDKCTSVQMTLSREESISESGSDDR